MTPEEITSVFATAAAAFTPIMHQPTDDDLVALRDVLYPILLDIPYDEDGQHNLIGLIEPMASYTATWGAPFPIAPPPAGTVPAPTPPEARCGGLMNSPCSVLGGGGGAEHSLKFNVEFF